MNKEPKAIGPVPIRGSGHEEPETEQDEPFKVDKSDPDQQELARLIGWDRLYEIEKADRQPTDLQRSPFPKGGVVVRPR